jgi:hypothetical protein
MGIQPSGSNTGLLLQCPFPFSPSTEIPEEGQHRRADYGLAFHEVGQRVVLEMIAGKPVAKRRLKWAAQALERHGNPAAPVDLAEHVRVAFDELFGWLRGENPWDKDFLEKTGKGELAVNVEKSFAVEAVRVPRGYWRVRQTDSPDADHVYDLRRFAVMGPRAVAHILPMTVDLWLEGEDWSLVIDYKSGRWGDWSSPTKVPQMRSAGLVPDKSDTVYLAVLDANRDGVPAVYGNVYEPEDRERHARVLYRALDRVGQDFMRTGPECRYCPARDVCPTQTADLVAEGHAIVKALEGGLAALAKNDKISPADKVGIMHQAFAVMAKLHERVAPDMRRFVEQSEDFVVRPDGQLLITEKRNVERIAGKEGYIRTLGKVEAERRFVELRGEGLMATTEEVHLRAVPNERVSR